MENWAEELAMRNMVRGWERIEDFKPAEEIEHFQNINTELLEVCKLAIQALKNVRANGETAYLPIIKRGEQAIAKAERGA